MVKINEAAKLLGRLNRSNQQFSFALSDWSDSDHRIGEIEQSVRQDPRIDREVGEKAIAKAEREAGAKLETVLPYLGDDSPTNDPMVLLERREAKEWRDQNRAAKQACIDAGINFHGRENDLHAPGHMLHTIRTLQNLRGYYGRDQYINDNCNRLVAEIAEMGIDTTKYLPALPC